MTKMQCPKCGAEVPAEDGWAKAAISTTIAAAAVTDMATQIRCPSCQVVFAQSDVIFSGVSPAKPRPILVWVLVVALFLWAIY